MKKILFLVSGILSFISNTKSQNLVPNFSFELDTACPNSISKIFYATPWFQPCVFNGNTTNSSTSDLYNSCDNGGSGDMGVPYNNGFASYQLARTGVGYAAIGVVNDPHNYREYLEVTLLDSLITNHYYCVEFYVSLADACGRATSNMGVYFSVDSLLDTTNVHAIDYIIPQIENPLSNMLSDTANWMLISGSFIANGGERFLTIGNFHNPANTNEQLLSTSIGLVTAYYYVDDVSVVDCTVDRVNELSNSFNFKLYPNPNNGDMIVEYHLNDNENAEVSIYDLLGRKLRSYTINSKNTTFNISESLLNAGTYYCSIRVNDKVVKTENLIIIK